MLLPPTSKAPPAEETVPVVASLPLAEELLANGLRLRFYDQSNRYFGDYHRVKIVVEIEVALNDALISDPELLTAGLKRFGATLITTRVQERMGVPSDRVESLRAELVASYQREVQSYLSRPEVPSRLLRAELGNKPTASTILRMLR